MSKKTKVWLIVGISLVVAGGMAFSVVMSMLNWNFSKLSTFKYVTNEHNITEEFKNISITADTADITFVPSDDGKISVICCEQEKVKHVVSVENGTLEIKIKDSRKWYEYIGINFGSPKITVYIPQGEYGALVIKSSTSDVKLPEQFMFESIDVSVSTGDVRNYASASGTIKIKTSTGDIKTEKISAGALGLSVSTGKITASDIECDGDVHIKVSTGKVNLSNLSCKNLTSNGNTGSIYLKDVIVKENLSIKRSTGYIKFEKCDASEIFVKTDTGDVKGSLLSSKVFIARTDTGRIDVPKTVSGGRCEIVTDTGDIKITVAS